MRIETPRWRDRARLALARWSWRYYRRASFPVEVRTSWGRSIVPISHGAGLENVRHREVATAEIAARVFQRRRGNFLDVGANCGQTLLAVHERLGPIPYLAIEPNPRAVAYLRRLIESNHYHHVHILPFAIGDTARTTALFHGDDYDVSASLVRGFRPASFYRTRTPVEVRIGDEVMARECDGPVALAKVDVEGAELEVFRGLRRTLDEDRPVLLFELLGHGPIARGEYFEGIHEAERARIVENRRARARSLEQLLRGAGYALHAVEGFGPGSAIATFDDEDLVAVDVLALPEGRPAFDEIGG